MSNGKRKLFVFSLILAFMLTGLPSQADTFRPVVRGKRGVVAGGSPLSVEAGLLSLVVQEATRPINAIAVMKTFIEYFMLIFFYH